MYVPTWKLFYIGTKWVYQRSQKVRQIQWILNSLVKSGLP